jgi:hypothetical protein
VMNGGGDVRRHRATKTPPRQGARRRRAKQSITLSKEVRQHVDD